MRNLVRIPEVDNRKGFPWAPIILLTIFVPYVGVPLCVLKGIRQGNRDKLRRFRDIALCIDDRDEIAINEIALRLGRKTADVKEDLEDMIDEHYFVPGTHFDRRGNIVFGPAVRSGFTETVNVIVDGVTAVVADVADEVSRKLRNYRGAQLRNDQKTVVHQTVNTTVTETAPKAEPAPEPKAEPKPKREPAKPSYEVEFERILQDIRRVNDEIADPAVSERIDRIGDLTSGIFSVVRMHPEQEAEVRKFMDYYLPTTLKLLNNYALMEKQSYQGENITTARKKIEGVLDTLVTAFERLSDNLFSASAMDIDADVSVLETMVKSDGLVKSGPTLTLNRTASGK
ncbi:MAG: 5-bromo-4-chloroindolyl phosphate hydrolysis family protein [Clostridia bacterium]|nr:5-bromo-4-chloroindolyl phosphate hydrolysis family protein [Clostridia bacterium]